MARGSAAWAWGPSYRFLDERNAQRGVLQCVAGCRRVLQGVAVCCSVLQCVAAYTHIHTMARTHPLSLALYTCTLAVGIIEHILK